MRPLTHLLVTLIICLPFIELSAGRSEQTVSPPVRQALEILALFRIRSLASKSKHPLSNITLNSISKRKLKQYRSILRQTPSRTGMFISIFDNRTRKVLGCMGGLFPVKDNLLDELEHWSRIAYYFGQTEQNGGHKGGGEFSVIISFIQKVKPVAHYYGVNSLQSGLLVRYQGREALVLPGEAFTSAYAFRMVKRKLNISKTPIRGLEYFQIKAERFGGAKKLFDKRSAKFNGYGG